MKKLVVLLAIGWTLIGKMEMKHWNNLTPPEKKAVMNLFTDKYFQANKCGGAEFRVMDNGVEIQFYGNCTTPQLEA